MFLGGNSLIEWKISTFGGTFCLRFARFCAWQNQSKIPLPECERTTRPRSLQLRLLTEPAELERCAARIVAHHYLQSATLVGEHQRYVATYKGEWLAVVCFSAGSYHLRHRDQFIGWSPEQRRRRLPLVVNNSRLLILLDAHYPNLASCLLKQVLARLSDDWLARWGHPVALVETFVDPECFRGTTYKVSGWSELGPGVPSAATNRQPR
ncbi:MAG: DUF4338 domain-containing protein [Opitutus sp.]|nr:DUF4338 domain-containing protein [Opitutus sp.]